jgi:serine/threonine protein phosphatase PrpC
MKDGYIYEVIGDNMVLACIFDGHGGITAVNYLKENFSKVF